MSGYSVGSRNEAYGSVTRVVIASTLEKAQQQQQQRGSPATWSLQNQSESYLTLPPRRQRADAQSRPTTIAATTTGSENYWASSTRQHDFTVTTHAIQQQRPPLPRRRREDFDEQHRAAATSSAMIHRASTGRQHVNAVIITGFDPSDLQQVFSSLPSSFSSYPSFLFPSVYSAVSFAVRIFP